MIKSVKTYHPIGFWLLILGISFLSSCEEQIEWDLQSQDLPAIVVDAQLTNELKFQHIHLSKPFDNQNGEAIAVSGANVIVEMGNTIMPFLESPDHPGHYYSQWQSSTSIGVDYFLHIQHDNQEYLAETYMIPVLPSAGPQWIYHEDIDLYSIQWPAGTYSYVQQAMFEAVISWDHLVDSSLTDTITSARIMYYTFNTIDVSYTIFPQDKENVYFPRNSLAIVKKYSLNDEYAAYLRALLAETEWQGSLFEDARGNLPGNVSHGALGYFSACSILSDTLVVH